VKIKTLDTYCEQVGRRGKGRETRRLFLHTDFTTAGNFQSVSLIIKVILVIIALYYIDVCGACDEITGPPAMLLYL
jgi:hypothetical protein